MNEKVFEFSITSTLGNMKLFHKALSCLAKVSTQVQFSLFAELVRRCVCVRAFARANPNARACAQMRVCGLNEASTAYCAMDFSKRLPFLCRSFASLSSSVGARGARARARVVIRFVVRAHLESVCVGALACLRLTLDAGARSTNATRPPAASSTTTSSAASSISRATRPSRSVAPSTPKPVSPSFARAPRSKSALFASTAPNNNWSLICSVCTVSQDAFEKRSLARAMCFDSTRASHSCEKVLQDTARGDDATRRRR